MLAPAAIAEAYIDACHAELQALKPGNVHKHAAGHGMDIAHFETSAAVSAPEIARPGASVGARILAAVEQTLAAVACNTNLGIVLLCAPLARAAEIAAQQEPLRRAVARVLADLDVTDADAAFRAIALANPAGLGHDGKADVAEPARVTLREAMRLAAARDRIAAAYCDDFAEIFTFATPRLAAAHCTAASPDLAVTTLHMALLASRPDSHIARKHGLPAAEAVRDEASALAHLWQPVVAPSAIPALHAFDRSLKQRGLNPGTTADLVVATLFVRNLQA